MPDHPDLRDQGSALLSFFLGPVQPFIAGARTVRDLWTGSYLLVWLTVAAIRRVLAEVPVTDFVSPELRDNPLLWTLKKNGPPPDGITIPCLPNRFIVRIPAGVDAHKLARACEQECDAEWAKVCKAVRARLLDEVKAKAEHFTEAKVGERTVDLLRTPWDRLWPDQVPTFFEVRTAVLFPGPMTDEDYERLLHSDAHAPRTPWQAQMAVLSGLADAQKGVRHVPPYRPTGDVPQKCTLLGSYEQMGPAPLDESRAFWAAFAEHVRVEGERVREGERLCAISLVKRFAWPAYLAGELRQRVNEPSYSDTATVAAACWLPEARERHWSGQWLHWRKPDQDKDEKCPEDVWKRIQERKRERGNPPPYYAILVADADRLGDQLLGRGGRGDERRSRQVSGALTDFALAKDKVRAVIEAHQGELIYSGGDDTLALVPTERVVACAGTVRDKYADNWRRHFPGEAVATISAGIAVVHYKEDLRFALDLARKAEALAKGGGRDALAVTVCRRSGEQTSAVLGWGQTDALKRLVVEFTGDVSDRWAYKLRGLLPTFRGMPWDSFVAELRRLLQRVEAPTAQARAAFARLVLDLCEQYRGEMTDEGRETPIRKHLDADVMADFVTLCQSASFLARGREEA